MWCKSAYDCTAKILFADFDTIKPVMGVIPPDFSYPCSYIYPPELRVSVFLIWFSSACLQSCMGGDSLSPDWNKQLRKASGRMCLDKEQGHSTLHKMAPLSSWPLLVGLLEEGGLVPSCSFDCSVTCTGFGFASNPNNLAWIVTIEHTSTRSISSELWQCNGAARWFF